MACICSRRGTSVLMPSQSQLVEHKDTDLDGLSTFLKILIGKAGLDGPVRAPRGQCHTSPYWTFNATFRDETTRTRLRVPQNRPM